MVIARDSFPDKFSVPSLRKSYSRIPDVVDLPHLIRIQLDSYEAFKSEALRELLDEISPIQDFTGNRLEMRFTDYSFGEPKYNPTECRERDATYAAPLRVNVQSAEISPPSLSRHWPMTLKFSSARPYGSMRRWQLAQVATVRCFCRRSRTVSFSPGSFG